MKKCKQCGEEKELTAFAVIKDCIDGRRPLCRVCAKVNDRSVINKLKHVPCIDCHVLFPPECMDFDHVRGEKLFNISIGVGTRKGIKTILAEIAKCEVVCANCHRIRTQRRRVG